MLVGEKYENKRIPAKSLCETYTLISAAFVSADSFKFQERDESRMRIRQLSMFVLPPPYESNLRHILCFIKEMLNRFLENVSVPYCKINSQLHIVNPISG